LLTVPAYQWLWSGHDVSLGHFRRYTSRHLRARVKAAGFNVPKCSYAIMVSFPLIVAFRLYQRLFQPKKQASSYVELPNGLNRFFINLLRMEAVILERVNFPFGTSILLIAQKQLAGKCEAQAPTVECSNHTLPSPQDLVAAGE
jgi:hypothetical protein